MTIIEIAPLSNGAHRNQTTSSAMTPPEGWAIIPANMITENFPFGEVEVSQTEVKGIGTVSVVTKWVPGVIPEPEPEPEPKPEPPTEMEQLRADVDYLLMMQEG